MDSSKLAVLVLGSLSLGNTACEVDGGNPPDPVTAPVAGLVTDAAMYAPVPDALVEVVDGDASSMTDDMGAYSLDLEVGGAYWLRAGGDGFIPTMRPVQVSEDGVSAFELNVLPPMLADGVYAMLGLAPRDASKGIVAVHFLNRSVAGGESVTLDADHDGSFSFDAMQAPAVTDALLEGMYDGVIFINVEPGVVTSTLSADTACVLVNLEQPQGMVLADELTRIDYDCAE